MSTKKTYDKSESPPVLQRDRVPSPSAEERASRKATRNAEAAVAMAEHEARETAKRANMERLRAERLAKERGEM